MSMKCNKCEAELEEGVTLCPNCGYDNTPAEQAAEAVAEEWSIEADAAEEAPVEETAEEETVSEEIKEEDSVEQAVSEEAQEEETPVSQEDEKKSPHVVEIKLTPGKIALLVVIFVALIAVIVALIVSGMNHGQTVEPTDTVETTDIAESAQNDETNEIAETTEATVPADGNPDDVTCKGTYTVSDDEMIAARDTVVATFGDAELTNGELQVYYWMQFYNFMNSEMGMYASYLGLDYSKPLETQTSTDGTTWQQYFLDTAIDAWHTYTALNMEAEKAGFQMDPTYAEEIAAIPDDMEQTAVASGFENGQKMLESEMGVGATLDDYMNYVNEYYNFALYYNEQMEAKGVSDSEAEAYFDENADHFAESGYEKGVEYLVDVRHILITPEGGTTDDSGMTTYSDEEWEACRVKAQNVLDEWLAGEATEDSFAELAKEYSEDGNASEGGIYEGVYKGQMVEEYENWCFDESRKTGDYGLVQTQYGYHVMYFVDRYENPEPSWLTAAKEEMMNNIGDELVKNACDAYEFNVDYSAIALGYVDLSVSE